MRRRPARSRATRTLSLPTAELRRHDRRRRRARAHRLHRRHHRQRRYARRFASPPTCSCSATPIQKGLVPVSAAAIEKAIELNAVAVSMPTSRRSPGADARPTTGAAGRAAAVAQANPDRVATISQQRSTRSISQAASVSPDRLSGRRLCGALQGVRAARARRRIAQHGRTRRTYRGRRALLLKLLAYKDEYEVRAALHRRHVPEGDRRRSSRATISSNSTLAPPLIKPSGIRDRRTSKNEDVRAVDAARLSHARQACGICGARGSTSSAIARIGRWSAS